MKTGILRASITAAGLLLGSSLHAQTMWRVDDLKQLGGNAVSVVGAPRVDTIDGRKAVVFDGVDDGLFVPSLPLVGAKTFTIEMLIRPEGGNHEQRFLHIQDTAERRALLELRADEKGGWWLDAFLRSDIANYPKGLPLIDQKLTHPTDRWYWVAMRFDGKRLASFVNGVKELEGETGHVPFSEGKTSLGVRQNLVSWFKGAIAEVRFHPEALPDEKLQRVKK